MTDETPEPIAVAIVAHTHWDREWYLAFETFRVRLVGLIDGLLDLLERDQFYERFLLDGQTAVIDDYLAVRPEAESRIKALARAERLQVGPWMILMDEFMVSGETIVRNLQWGMKRARELGGLMEVGYLPDMFGHVAQMPQILSLAGLNDAVVWRGVPNEIVKSAFWWEAPNGSRVRAEYLIGSYSNGRDLPDTGSGLVARAHSYEQELGSARLDNGSMLLMNGTDHQIPQPGLSQAVAQANESQARYEFKITTLADYLAGVPRNDLALWRGEMRSGGRANVLMGVASNRVDVHRAAARAERAVERRAEPLNALLREPDQYPTTLLATAWENLILNSAHDSSCACSSDEVVDAVMVRYQQARQIGDALVNQAVQEFADRSGAPMGSTVVVNPTAHRRSGTVNLSVPGMGPVHFVSATGISCPTQIVNQT
ncbi:MAG: alpha-mannosidase, partial [Actinobacteria bacterium]|nr:alpha-mannosidase [Actinomycetota bacterium]